MTKGILTVGVLGLCLGAFAKVDVVAVYYPHWHRYPKGDEWFGSNRWQEAEWAFVKSAKPRFPGHVQPIKPLPGYLDGKDPADVETEIELASNAGIDVFLYDYYYYNGEVTQEEAIEQGFLKAPNRGKMKFALMWCFHDRNFAWRVPLFSARKKLMTLARTPEEFLGLIDLSIERYFKRPEYWRKDGKLFFSIFAAPRFVEALGPEAAKAAIAEARARIRRAGLGELELNGQNASLKEAALLKAVGFDSLTHYNGHAVKNGSARYRAGERLFDFAETTDELARRYAEMAKAELPYYPSVSTGWDATPRCRYDEPFPWRGPKTDYPYCLTLTNATPAIFERNLRQAKRFAETDAKRPNVVYINAWNEYTEGCHLLPTVRECDLRLRAVASVFGRRPADRYVYCDMKRWWDPKAANGRTHAVEAPTLENLKYGPHPRQGLDVWLPAARAAKPTPVLVNIHGGAWVDGDRMGGVDKLLAACRRHGAALVTISYRMVADANDAGVQPPVKACLDDAVAAVAFVQAHAKEWNVDPTRVGLTGGSAGACSSLYASFQGDNALGVRGILVNSPQTSLDPKEMREWIPNIRYGSHAFGVAYGNFDAWLARREACLPQIERYSPAALARRCTPARAPLVLYSCGPLPPKGELPKDPPHAAMFCVKFQEICEARGIACRRGTLDELLDALSDK